MGALAPIIERASEKVLSGDQSGVTVELLHALRGLGLSSAELDTVADQADRTLERKAIRERFRFRSRVRLRLNAKRQRGQRISDAEEALRIARVVEHAIRVFVSEDKAIKWLRRENKMLANRRAIDLLKSETGAQVVEEALHRIDYGIYA